MNKAKVLVLLTVSDVREEFVNDQQHLELSAASKIRCQNEIKIQMRLIDLGAKSMVDKDKCFSFVSTEGLKLMINSLALEHVLDQLNLE